MVIYEIYLSWQIKYKLKYVVILLVIREEKVGKIRYSPFLAKKIRTSISLLFNLHTFWEHKDIILYN